MSIKSYRTALAQPVFIPVKRTEPLSRTRQIQLKKNVKVIDKSSFFLKSRPNSSISYNPGLKVEMLLSVVPLYAICLA